MKKVYDSEGKSIGCPSKIEEENGDVVLTFQGDMPGMAERKSIYVGCSIVYEDSESVHINY